MSQKVVDQHWDVFAPSVENSSTQKYQYFKYANDDPAISSGTTQTLSNYTLRTKDLDQWMLPSKGYLLVRFKILAAGGANNATVITNLINGGMHLFRDARYSVNGSQISHIDYPGFVQVMDSLRTMSKDEAESVADLEWFYPDSHQIRLGDADDQSTNPTVMSPSNNAKTTASEASGVASLSRYSYLGADNSISNVSEFYNESYFRRFARSHTSQEVELCIPLARIFGFCRDVPVAMRGLQHEIRLTKSGTGDYATILHSANGTADMQTLLTRVELWMPAIQPSLEVASALESALANKASSKWVWEDATTFISPSYTSASETWKITTTSHKPTLALIGFQHSLQYTAQADGAAIDVEDASTGPTRVQNANGGIFSYLNDIEKVEIRVNSERYPFEAYQLSFQSDLYSRAYIDFLRSGGKWNGDDGLVSKADYRDLYPIFAFDLSQSSDLYEKVKSNDIEVNWQVSPNGQTYRAVCVLYTEKEAVASALDGRMALTL